MTTILFGLIATGAGIAGAFQAAANAGLASRIGLAPALVMNTSIVLLGTLVFYFARGPHGSFFASGTPWSLYVGGICGFVLLMSLAFVFPRIGAAVAIALVVLGQGVAALAIDHFGLLGMPTEPITLARVAGLLLVGGGVVLIRG
jgi:bacterial/archaeal transporter family-2 protein